MGKHLDGIPGGNKGDPSLRKGTQWGTFPGKIIQIGHKSYQKMERLGKEEGSEDASLPKTNIKTRASDENLVDAN